MSVAIVTLSSKGQVVIPKEVRDELHWAPGTQLTLISGPGGVTLKAVPRKTGRNLADLVGMLKHDGPALSTTENTVIEDIESVSHAVDWYSRGADLNGQ